MSKERNPILDELRCSTTSTRSRTYSGSHSAPSTPGLSSPVPLSSFDLYRKDAESGCSTPESEIENSLAYQDSLKYDSQSKLKRKLRKRHALESENSENQDGSEIAIPQPELDGKNSVFQSSDEEAEDAKENNSNNKYTQTDPQEPPKQVRLRYASTSEGPGGAKIPQTYTVESRSMQTAMTWSYLESLFQNIDTENFERMKEGLATLQEELVGEIKKGLPEVRFYFASNEDDASDDSLGEVDVEDNKEAENEDMVSKKLSKKVSSSVGKKKESKAGGVEAEKKPDGRRMSLVPELPNSRRTTSAHCLGGRKGTLSELEENIFDVFKSRGETAKKVQPQILKYVGEKSDLRPDIDDATIEKSYIRGWYDGLCQFCGEELLEIPTLEEIMDPEKSVKVKYCCPSFKYFIGFHLEHEEVDEPDDELIDVNPNAPFRGRRKSLAARKRLQERQRERELEKQKAAAQQANLFSFARQMKTLSYSLASNKCMTEGWTIKPTTPKPPSPLQEINQFEIEVNTTLLQTAGVLVNKYYDNGQRFLTIFPDGTGCLYYPSGHVAVMITSIEKGKYTYIVQTNKSYNDLEDNGLLAVFEPNGNSVCYFRKSKRIRTFINAHGGIELDPKGRRRKRWQWYFTKNDKNTPPFHPLHFSFNKFLSVRILNQHNIALVFASAKRSVRFNVAANLKALTFRGRGHFEGHEAEKFLSEKKKRIATVLQNIHRSMRLPRTSRTGKYPTTSQKKKERLQELVSQDVTRRVTIAPLPPIITESVVVTENSEEKHSF